MLDLLLIVFPSALLLSGGAAQLFLYRRQAMQLQRLRALIRVEKIDRSRLGSY